MRFFHKVALAAVLLMATLGWGGAIKTWVSGDTLTIPDLNANFAHIHNSMVGGHGGRLVNADVSALAAIGYTKVQNGRGIARAFAVVSPICNAAGSCTLADSLNVTSIVRGGSAGIYTMTLNYNALDNKFVAVASAGAANSSVANVDLCQAFSVSVNTVGITCWSLAAAPAVVADTPFSVVIFDGN